MVAMGATGCVAVTIMENPTTGQRVNCTAEAVRLAYAKDPSASTGKDVPQYVNTPPSLTRFDYERQCVGNLKREGFVCVSGC